MTTWDATTERFALVGAARDEPPQPLLVVLYARDHERIGQRAALRDGLCLGRACTAFGGIPLDDARMSRQHATVHRVDGAFVLEDAGSTNGTVVNGRETAREVLREGDVVQVGDTFLQYVVAAADSGAVAGSLLEGYSPAVEALRKGLAVVAPTGTTVLVIGEPGVGKRTVGREVHRLSGRPGPVVAVECGAGTPEEVEEQLFGQAQAGPVVDGPQLAGAMTAASRGTLLLVDVDRLSPRAQVRLAWALDELSRRHATGGGELPRLVATARERVESGAEERGFREDLYSRLITWSVDVPPLRDRPLDVGALAAFCLRRFAEHHGSPEPTLSPELVWALLDYTWPRNVPELLAVVEAGCVETAAAADPVVRITPRLEGMLGPDNTRRAPAAGGAPEPRNRRELVAALRHHDLVISRVAQYYDKHRQQIYRWMDRYEIDLDDLRRSS